MGFKDYCKILEISFRSNEEEIKKAYRRLSLKWHPDKNPGTDTSNIMVDINEAYYILGNPEKKKRYDSEYLRYTRYEEATNQNTTNNNHAYSNYTPHDSNVRQDINDAHEKASELVAEFFNSLKKTSKDAIKGAWDEMLPYILGGITLTLISLIILVATSR